jgi:hypothetical protein
MKKLFIVFPVLLLSIASIAQIKKGQWLVGGTAGFTSSQTGSIKDTKVTSFTFSPDAGYFFINNLAGGLRVNINSAKEHDEDAMTSLVFSPFVRYYFLPAAQRVNILADASYGFGSVKAGGNSESFNQFAFAAGPAVFLSPNTALEFTLQYSSAGGDAYGGNDRQNNFGVNVGFQVHLGK